MRNIVQPKNDNMIRISLGSNDAKFNFPNLKQTLLLLGFEFWIFSFVSSIFFFRILCQLPNDATTIVYRVFSHLSFLYASHYMNVFAFTLHTLRLFEHSHNNFDVLSENLESFNESHVPALLFQLKANGTQFTKKFEMFLLTCLFIGRPWNVESCSNDFHWIDTFSILSLATSLREMMHWIAFK